MKKADKLIVLTAGGTGGHVYPADALANELIERGYRVVLFTDKRGLNNYKGKLGEIENKAIYSGSVVGKSLLVKIFSLFKVGIGILQAMFYMLTDRPRCVVGFGGYASFPTAVAAILLRIPLVVHEQNSVMSRTNRLLARFVVFAAQSFRKVKNTPEKVKTVLTGMPVRQSIVRLHERKYVAWKNGQKMPIIILGGSQGAKIFAEVVPQAIRKLPEKMIRNLVVYQQCRKGEEEKVKTQYEGLSCEVIVKSFFDNMPELYEQAKLIVSRSGASSVYEIAAAGLPAILVPLPTAADNHQYYNAKEFSDAGAAILAEQKDFNDDGLAQILTDCFEKPKMIETMAACAKKAAIVDSASRLADALEKI